MCETDAPAALVLYRRAIAAHGEESQFDMVVEECAELIVAIRHLARGRVSPLDVAEEIADVLITTRKLSLLVGPQLVASCVRRKLQTLEERVRLAENRGKT